MKLALLKARLALATGSIAQHRIFGHAADEVWFLLNTTAYRRYGFIRRVLPGVPDPEVQREFIGSDGDRALRETFCAYCGIGHDGPPRSTMARPRRRQARSIHVLL